MIADILSLGPIMNDLLETPGQVCPPAAALAEHIFQCPNYDYDYLKFIEKFGRQKTQLERFELVLGEMNHGNMGMTLGLSQVRSEKNDLLSESYRQRGNSKFAVGLYWCAMDLYTKSIAFATNGSASLALAYGNRSAALFRLSRFKECLVDIKRALDGNKYPTPLKCKLLERQATVLQRMTPSNADVNSNLSKFEILDLEENPKIQSASASVEIQRNDKYGRHVVATKNIEIGEVISVERPFACVTLPKSRSHCWECTSFCCNPIPCPRCTVTMYCSEACQSKAYGSYHQYECPIVSLLVDPLTDETAPGVILALRIAFLLKDEYAKEDFCAEQRSNDDVYRSDRYAEVTKLSKYESKFTVEDVLSVTYSAAGLFKAIKKHTDFLKCPVGADLIEKRFKEQLVSLLLISNANSFVIKECKVTANETAMDCIGIGLFPFASLVNHSCNANVTQVFYGSNMVQRATRSIKKGEQCFIHYEIHYAAHPKYYRQKYLKNRYGFDCDCQPCKCNWAPFDFLPIRSQIDLQLRFEMHCGRLFKPDAKYVRAILPVLLAEYNKNLQFEPCKELAQLQMVIYKCLNFLGNKQICL